MRSVIDQDDRISQLPDPILHKILSHLRTREAVRTIIVSKRWESLWASMPYFSFDDHQGQSFNHEAFPDFVRIINAVLQARGPFSIDTFQLWWSNAGLWWSGGFDWHGQQHLNTWSEHVVRRNVKILELDISITELQVSYEEEDEAVQIPLCIFTCRSVEELSLLFHFYVCVKLILPELVGLSRLRKLFLENIKVDCDSLKKLISGCPVLESLVMFEGALEDPDISSHSLKSLEIGTSEISGDLIRISAPNLHSINLNYNDIEGLDVCLGYLSSIIDASVQIDDYCHGWAFTDTNPLKFVTSRTEHESKDPKQSTFCNLKKLTLCGRHIKENFQAVTYFLEESPNLELLVLQNLGLEPQECWSYEYDCPHLKMDLRVKCGDENESVFEMVDEFFQGICDCPSD